jgi:hypothetical protein
LLDANPISWFAQKQGVVAISSYEAEYVTAAAKESQGVWLSRLISELTGMYQKKFKLLVENKSAIALCKKLEHHGRNKHIDTKCHYMRECIEAGEMEVNHVSTNDQLADIPMKALGWNKFVENWRSEDLHEVAGLRGISVVQIPLINVLVSLVVANNIEPSLGSVT